MKAKELIQIFELGRAFKEKRTRTPKADPDMTQLLIAMLAKQEDSPSLTALLQKKMEEADTLKDFLQAYEKANKKEEKKDDKKGGVNHDRLAFWLVMLFPLYAPFYVHYILGR